jgi:hypothetical protein
MLVLAVRLQVFGQLLNPIRQQGDLHLRRSGILFVTRVFLNNRIFFVFCKCHVLSSLSPGAPDKGAPVEINLMSSIAEPKISANAQGRGSVRFAAFWWCSQIDGELKHRVYEKPDLSNIDQPIRGEYRNLCR